MRGAAIGKVAASKSAKFPSGTYVYCESGWTEMAVVKEKNLQKLEIPENGKVTDALGVLGTYLPIRNCCLWRR